MENIDKSWHILWHTSKENLPKEMSEAEFLEFMDYCKTIDWKTAQHSVQWTAIAVSALGVIANFVFGWSVFRLFRRR